MRWLLVVLVAGCWSQASPPVVPTEPAVSYTGSPRTTRRDDRCTTAIAHVFQVTRGDGSNTYFPAGLLDELEVLAVDNCRNLGWSLETLDCYENVASTQDSSVCYRKMTDEQRELFEKDYADVMQRYRSQPTP